jgi:hypothetical protein
MSNAVLGGVGVAARYETHRSQLMTLYVTRQGQQFNTGGDLQLCDISLISASVELVGEPGTGNHGIVSGIEGGGAGETTYNNTINALPINDAGITSVVFGIAGENRVLRKTHLNHGHLNISIPGLTEAGHQFKQDSAQPGNQIKLMVPTDLGLLRNRSVSWPPQPIELPNVILQQRINVNCSFAGTWPESMKVARFTEDWADSNEGIIVKRNIDNTVRYYPNDDEGQSSIQLCQVPSNCINSIKLVFKIDPQTVL